MLFPEMNQKEFVKFLKWTSGLTIVFVAVSCWLFWMSAKREGYLAERESNFLNQTRQPGGRIVDLIIRYHDKHGHLPQKFEPTVNYFLENGIAIPDNQTNQLSKVFGNYFYNLDSDGAYVTSEPWFLSKTGYALVEYWTGTYQWSKPSHHFPVWLGETNWWWRSDSTNHIGAYFNVDFLNRTLPDLQTLQVTGEMMDELMKRRNQ